MVYCSLFENSFILCCFLNQKIPQAHPIPPELTAKLLGNRVAVSPIVTVEPRRRKFHKPITLTIPVPQAAGKGMINQYNGETPTLRLLCSITGTFLVLDCLVLSHWSKINLEFIPKIQNFTLIKPCFHTVRNLHFLFKNSTLISRKNCRFIGGEKLVKMLWFRTC